MVPIGIHLRKDMFEIDVRDWIVGGDRPWCPTSFLDLLNDLGKLIKLYVVDVSVPAMVTVTMSLDYYQFKNISMSKTIR